MRAWLRYALLILPLAAWSLAGCVPVPIAGGSTVRTRHVTVTDGGAVQTEAVVADLTLGLFWKLASLQVQDRSAASRLLSQDAEETAATLQSLGVGFDAYRQQLASVAQVRPLVLFLPHDADPVKEAQRRGISRIPWPPLAPPALLSGPQVDTLIVYEPIAAARLASVAGLTGLSLAPGPPADPAAIRRLYQVRPGEWKNAAVFEHTRCVQPEPGMTLVTKLVYQGGFTDSSTTSLTEQSWGPCALSPEPELRAATVKQTSRPKPGKPVIIAASYFLSPEPSPLLARWVSVR